MADYIPGPDANFQAWQSNFVTYANASLVSGLVAADMAPITAAQTTWNTAFPAHRPRQRRQGRQADQGRAGRRTSPRSARWSAACRPRPRWSDAERAAAGITVKSAPSPIQPPPRRRWSASTPATACSTRSGSSTPPTDPARKPAQGHGRRDLEQRRTTPPANKDALTVCRRRYQLAVCAELRLGRGRQDRVLLAPLRQPDRRTRAVERADRGDDRGVRTPPHPADGVQTRQ